jgi:hypothetical protein
MLKWRIHYSTPAFWCNYIMSVWDEFSDNFKSNYSFDLNLPENFRLPRFRNSHFEEYNFFRNFFQLIDLISLDFDSLKFSDRTITVTILYLLVGLFIEYFNLNQLLNFLHKDLSLFNELYDLNTIFNRFCNLYLNLELDEIFENLNYVCYFFYMDFDYCNPTLPKDESTRHLSYELLMKTIPPEEFFQIQTHNRKNLQSLEMIKKMKSLHEENLNINSANNNNQNVNQISQIINQNHPN